MKYELVVRDGFKAMNEEVNEMLQDGWELQGGTSMSHAPSGTKYFCQAMIKRDEIKVNQNDLQDVIKRTNKDIKEFLSKYN